LPAPRASAADPAPLKYGMSGTAVKTLQTHLMKRGYLSSADGKFGKATLAAVKLFQNHAGLPQDGVAGPKTQQTL
jgi:N-acetylmuramoyl-L-alanine amidase